MHNLDYFDYIPVIEMAEKTSIDVPFDPRLDMDEITKGDDSPLYAIVEVLRSALSRNKRRYSKKNVEQIAEKLVSTPAYLGHANPNGVGWEFREPMGVFVGSKVEEIDENTNRCLGKFYIFESSPLREWLPKTNLVQNPLQVSISAKATGIQKKDEIVIHDITELDSVDFCNSGTAGMTTSVVLDVTEIYTEGEIETMDRQEIIASLTVEEIQSAPAFADIPAPEVVEQITEMTLTVAGEERTVALEEVQSIIEEMERRPLTISVEIDGENKTLTGEEIHETLCECWAKRDLLQAKIDEIEAKRRLDELNAYKEAKVTEMFDESQCEVVMKRITADTEEGIDTQINEMKDFISELNIGVIDNPVAPPQRKEEDTNELLEGLKSLFSK